MQEQFTYAVDDFSAGWYTNIDPGKAPLGSCINGHNIRITDGGEIAPALAKQLFYRNPEESSPITSSGVLITRDRGEVFVYHTGTTLKFFNELTGKPEVLKTGLADGKFFGFVQSSENTRFTDFLHFGNGRDPDMEWNGAYDVVDGAVSSGATSVSIQGSVLSNTVHYSGSGTASTTSITVSGTPFANDIYNDKFVVLIKDGAQAGAIRVITDTEPNKITFSTLSSLSGTRAFEIRQLRFAASGSLILGGVVATYTGFADENTFSGMAGVPDLDDGVSVAQAVTEYPENPRGDMHRMLDGCRYIFSTTSSTWYRSKVFNPVDFTFSNPRSAGEGDIVDNVDAQGNHTGVAVHKGWLLALKQDLVKPYRYSQDTSDIVTSDTENMKRSLWCGNEFPLGVIEVDNAVYSCVTGRGIRALAASSEILGNQTLNLSLRITPSIEDYDFSTACNVFVYDRVFISCKSQRGLPANDTTLVFNFVKQSWELPMLGAGFSSFFIWKGGLYGTSATTEEIYRVWNGIFEEYDGESIGAISRWEGSYLNMGMPAQRKKFTASMVEGYVAKGTNINFGYNFEYRGSQGSISTVISGDDGNITFTVDESGSLGMHELAVEPLGTGEDDLGNEVQRFRVILTTSEKPFYEVQPFCWSDGIAQNWSISRISWNVVQDPTHTTTIKQALT